MKLTKEEEQVIRNFRKQKRADREYQKRLKEGRVCRCFGPDDCQYCAPDLYSNAKD